MRSGANPNRRTLRRVTDPAHVAPSWTPWRVVPTSGFEVDEPHGNVGFIQIDRKRFLVRDAFRFSDPAVEQMLVDRLVSDGKSADQARAAVDDARTFTPTAENPTDMASVPRYMRWFESAYGAHTLAAIIHDNLIVDEPNAGALGSDTLADRFFREMLGSAGVPCLKRWIMWTAVALRSRWAAGGTRRFSVIAWIVLAIVGIVSFVWGVGAALFDWSRPVDTAVLFLVAAAVAVCRGTVVGQTVRSRPRRRDRRPVDPAGRRLRRPRLPHLPDPRATGRQGRPDVDPTSGCVGREVEGELKFKRAICEQELLTIGLRSSSSVVKG